MVVVCQGVLFVPWYDEMVCQALLLAVALTAATVAAAAADCVFVMLAYQ